MRLIVILENAYAINPSETAKEAAPSSQYHSPCFKTSIGKVYRVGASSNRNFLRLGLSFFNVGVGDALRFGQDNSFGFVVFWVY